MYLDNLNLKFQVLTLRQGLFRQTEINIVSLGQKEMALQALAKCRAPTWIVLVSAWEYPNTDYILSRALIQWWTVSTPKCIITTYLYNLKQVSPVGRRCSMQPAKRARTSWSTCYERSVPTTLQSWKRFFKLLLSYRMGSIKQRFVFLSWKYNVFLNASKYN